MSTLRLRKSSCSCRIIRMSFPSGLFAAFVYGRSHPALTKAGSRLRDVLFRCQVWVIVRFVTARISSIPRQARS
jgi:hypothetical protein